MGKSPRKCKYCGSFIVCWNWFGPISDEDPRYDHECWDCENIMVTEYKVTDGVPYEALRPLSKLQRELGRPLEWNSALEVSLGS